MKYSYAILSLPLVSQLRIVFQIIPRALHGGVGIPQEAVPTHFFLFASLFLPVVAPIEGVE